MNTLLQAPASRTQHPPISTASLVVRRVGLVDRLALHLGVALITWSRRPAREHVSRERLANRHEQRLARVARELATERGYRILNPLR